MASKRSPSAKSKSSPAASSPNTGPTSPAIRTCESLPQQGSLPMELPSMSSAAGSLAKTSASQERALASQVNEAGCSTRSLVLLANWDHASSSWRTSERCFLEGWMSFSERWPRSGMMRNGIAYQLPTLVHLTDGTESGLWPTPDTAQGRDPKPESIECRGSSLYSKKTGAKVQLRLSNAVKLWPTPTARDWKGGRTAETLEKSGRGFSNSLNDALTVTGTSGALNPAWVEWLMGFPTGHTVCAPSETP